VASAAAADNGACPAMSRIQVLTTCVVVVLTGGLGACATYKKCGFAGCTGDANITAGVRSAINQYPSLEAPNSVRVETYDHVVYLYGQVNTELERAMADSVALAVPGVTRVVNSISLDDVGR
jgi:osmotically-inducible protein OsmY